MSPEYREMYPGVGFGLTLIEGQHLEDGLTIAAETLVEFGGGKIEFIDQLT